MEDSGHSLMEVGGCVVVTRLGITALGSWFFSIRGKRLRVLSRVPI